MNLTDRSSASRVYPAGRSSLPRSGNFPRPQFVRKHRKTFSFILIRTEKKVKRFPRFPPFFSLSGNETEESGGRNDGECKATGPCGEPPEAGDEKRTRRINGVAIGIIATPQLCAASLFALRQVILLKQLYFAFSKVLFLSSREVKANIISL